MVATTLIYLRAWFRLITCSPEDVIIFLLLSLSMGTMIYLQERPLMVMLIQGFVFPVLLMVLWISLIFLVERFRKLFFSLRIFLTLAEDVCAYNYPSLLPCWSWAFLLWKHDLLRSSFNGLERTGGGGGKLEKTTGLVVGIFSDFFPGFGIGTFLLNCNATFW